MIMAFGDFCHAMNVIHYAILVLLCEYGRFICGVVYPRITDRGGLVMGVQEQLSNFGYCSMGYGRSDYEGFYSLSDGSRFYGFHCHDFYEIFLFIRGARYFGVDNAVYHMEPNQLVIIPPFRMHGFLREDSVPCYERGYLYCSTEFLGRIGCGLVDLPALLTDPSAGPDCRMYSLTQQKAEECGELLRRLMDNNEAHTPYDRFTDLTYILPFFRIILETVRGVSPQLSVSLSNPTMHDVLVYVNDHFTEPLTLEILAAQCGVSVSSLSHEFIRYTHHSLYNYILYRRIMLAKQKLFEPLSLGDISLLCGFGDYSNFLRAFKKIVGVSPTEYRKQIQIRMEGESIRI